MPRPVGAMTGVAAPPIARRLQQQQQQQQLGDAASLHQRVYGRHADAMHRRSFSPYAPGLERAEYASPVSYPLKIPRQ